MNQSSDSESSQGSSYGMLEDSCAYYCKLFNRRNKKNKKRQPTFPINNLVLQFESWGSSPAAHFDVTTKKNSEISTACRISLQEFGILDKGGSIDEDFSEKGRKNNKKTYQALNRAGDSQIEASKPLEKPSSPKFPNDQQVLQNVLDPLMPFGVQSDQNDSQIDQAASSSNENQEMCSMRVQTALINNIQIRMKDGAEQNIHNDEQIKQIEPIVLERSNQFRQFGQNRRRRRNETSLQYQIRIEKNKGKGKPYDIMINQIMQKVLQTNQLLPTQQLRNEFYEYCYEEQKLFKRRYSGPFLFQLYGRLRYFGQEGQIYLLGKVCSEILLEIESMTGNSEKQIFIRKGLVANYKAARLLMKLIPHAFNLEARRSMIKVVVQVFKKESRIKFSQNKKSLECQNAYINV